MKAFDEKIFLLTRVTVAFSIFLSVRELEQRQDWSPLLGDFNRTALLFAKK